jgi:hypothetical protein
MTSNLASVSCKGSSLLDHLIRTGERFCDLPDKADERGDNWYRHEERLHEGHKPVDELGQQLGRKLDVALRAPSRRMSEQLVTLQAVALRICSLTAAVRFAPSTSL